MPRRLSKPITITAQIDLHFQVTGHELESYRTEPTETKDELIEKLLRAKLGFYFQDDYSLNEIESSS